MRQIMQWINDLTVAVIEEDSYRIGVLIDCMPSFENIQTAKEALILIKNALHVVEKQKSETFEIMQKIKQTKIFLLSDEAQKSRFIG